MQKGFEGIELGVVPEFDQTVATLLPQDGTSFELAKEEWNALLRLYRLILGKRVLLFGDALGVISHMMELSGRFTSIACAEGSRSVLSPKPKEGTKISTFRVQESSLLPFEDGSFDTTCYIGLSSDKLSVPESSLLDEMQRVSAQRTLGLFSHDGGLNGSGPSRLRAAFPNALACSIQGTHRESFVIALDAWCSPGGFKLLEFEELERRLRSPGSKPEGDRIEKLTRHISRLTRDGSEPQALQEAVELLMVQLRTQEKELIASRERAEQLDQLVIKERLRTGSLEEELRATRQQSENFRSRISELNSGLRDANTARSQARLRAKAAEGIVHSLRFRIGDLLLRSAKSPIALIKLPYRLAALAWNQGCVKRDKVPVVGSLLPAKPLPSALAEQELIYAYLNGGLSALESQYHRFAARGDLKKETLNRIMFDTLRTERPRDSVLYGERALEQKPDDENLRQILVKTYLSFRDRQRARELDLLENDESKVVSDLIPEGTFRSCVEPQDKSFPAIRAAAILDTFTSFCFDPELQLDLVMRENWRESLEQNRPDFFFAESAWQGNGGEWKYFFNKFESRDPNPLRELLQWCRDNSVPTVFWNKEDPVNFDLFLPAAKEFDYIFTTDADCVPRYREALGHDRVGVLPFAAQPLLHNPIAKGRFREKRTCFAGAWRGDKYKKRGSDFETLLKPFLGDDPQVDIFDRYADHPEREKLGFPEPYAKAVVGSLPYAKLVSRYRDYSFFLNVNSVSESPTMLSRRVFELLACRTPVISTPACAIDTFFPKLVLQTESPEQTRQYAERLFSDEEYRDRLAHQGYREVLSKHTYQQRTKSLLEKVLPQVEVKQPEPLVTVICVSRRPEFMEQCFEKFQNQSYPNTELIFVTNGEGFDRARLRELIQETPRSSAFEMESYRTLAHCLNSALSRANGDYWAKFDDDDVYAPNYLSDLMLCFSYSDAAIVGKKSFYCYMEEDDDTLIRFPGREYQYTASVSGATFVVHRKATERIPFQPVRRGTDSVFQRQCLEANLKIFSADRYNFILWRHKDSGKHTWNIDQQEFRQKCEFAYDGLAIEEISL